MDTSQPGRFEITDTLTGEVVSEEAFLNHYFSDTRQEQKKGFEIAYPHKVYRFMGIADSPQMQVLVYLLKVKSSQNLISETSRSIAAELGLSKSTVNTVMKRLQDEGLLMRVKQGTYLLDPDVMVYGGNNAWRTRDIWNKQLGELRK